MRENCHQILEPDAKHSPAHDQGEEHDRALGSDAGVGQTFAAELKRDGRRAHEEDVQQN